jgi:Zn-dependent protease with chaperone function
VALYCPLQIVAVLAHEIGHWQMWHTVCGMALSIVMTVAALAAFSLFVTRCVAAGVSGAPCGRVCRAQH